MIGHAGATSRFDADAEELGIRVGGEEGAEAGEGGGGLAEDRAGGVDINKGPKRRAWRDVA
jgi:hypothetical protein